MLIPGKRLLLAALFASATALSCAGCLGTSRLQAIHVSSPETQYAAVDNNELIRTHPVAVRSYTPPDHTQRQQVQQTPTPSSPFRYVGASGANHSPVHPAGKVSGIDIAVAEFAQANSNAPVIRYDQEWIPDQPRQIDADYTFIANQENTGLGIDLAVQPRVSFRTDGDVRTTRAGAEIRLGQNLDKRGQNVQNSNWYFFAGADGEAVVWDVNQAGVAFADNQISLQDRVTIGDVQAGIAWESPAGQMSFSYIEREYEYRNGAISRSGDENFVAVTLSWKH